MQILPKDGEKVVVGVIGLMSHLILDQVSQVATKAMAVVDIALRYYPHKIEKNRSTYFSSIESCFSSLMERIGDNNPKVRTQAHQTCLKLAANKNIGMKTLIGYMASMTPLGKKQLTSSKHSIGKLVLLHEMINTYGLEPKQPFTKMVIELALLGATNANADIRNEGYRIMVDIYRLLGSEVYKYLDSLRPAQREMLEEEFRRISGNEVEPKKESPRPIITTNIKPQGGAIVTNITKPITMKAARSKHEQVKARPVKPINEDYEAPIIEAIAGREQNTCEFCNRYDASFNSERLDLHMFKECPMLHVCKECGKAVELINLNQHLLTECGDGRKYKPCPVCKDPILKDFLDAHIQEGECTSYDPSEILRCPLCQKDLSPPTYAIWRQHILEEGCPNNPRTNP